MGISAKAFLKRSTPNTEKKLGRISDQWVLVRPSWGEVEIFGQDDDRGRNHHRSQIHRVEQRLAAELQASKGISSHAGNQQLTHNGDDGHPDGVPVVNGEVAVLDHVDLVLKVPILRNQTDGKLHYVNLVLE